MIRATRNRVLLVTAMVAALVPTVGAAPVAAADVLDWNESKVLNIDGFHQVILDEANEQLFMRGTGAVFVIDYLGKRRARIGNLPGDGLMSLGENGATLWIALGDDHAIGRIDTATRSRGAAIAVPDTVCPTSVAETNGKLAVGHDCDGGIAGIGTIDLGDDSWTNSSDSNVPTTRPIVATSPGATDIVVAGDRDGPARLRLFDVSTGDPMWLAENQRNSDLQDIAVDPTGEVVAMAAGKRREVPTFEVSDLSRWRTYEAEASTRALSWSGDGSVLATGSAEDGGDVHLYKRRVKYAKLHHEVDGEVAPRGVAMDAAAQEVWVVSESGGDFLLTRVTGLGWGVCWGTSPTIVGTDGDDVINGTSGVDVIMAGAGNDVIDGRGDDDLICGEEGEDTIFARPGDGAIDGGPQRDLITFERAGSSGVTVDLSAREATGSLDLRKVENVMGTPGDDTLIGDGKVNILDGGEGDDVIDGLGGNDILSGGPGLDFIEGGFGDDRIYGDEGDDLLIGEGGNDRILGLGGDDVLAGVAGDDILNGGTGADTASFAVASGRITASLQDRTATGEGTDTLKNIEWLVGSEQNDTLVGNARVNLLESRGGDDEIRGLDRGDTLNGGPGFDILDGGPGNDACLFGETHISCELIDTGSAIEPSWPASVWAAAQVWLPQTPMK